MDNMILAYLAGALDSDGSFGIRRSTYNRRVVGDAVNPTYFERVMLKQVTPQIPTLLKELFGGYFRLQPPATENSKPLYSFQVTCRQAANLCNQVLPYLRVKRRQAEILLELHESKESKYLHAGYWFVRAFPDWQQMEMITSAEVAALMGYANPMSVSQAASNGTLVRLPYDNSGIMKPRYPRKSVEWALRMVAPDGRIALNPPELMEWRERLWKEVRELNRVGINGTEIYHQTGSHKRID